MSDMQLLSSEWPEESTTNNHFPVFWRQMNMSFKYFVLLQIRIKILLMKYLLLFFERYPHMNV
jgi:hypothetical protein